MTKKRIIYIVGTIILIILAVVAGFVGYLQLSLFEVHPIEKNAIENYINQNNISGLSRLQDNLYEGFLPIEKVDDELTLRFIEKEQKEGRLIVSGNIDTQQGFGKMNYLLGSFYVPVYCEVTTKEIEQGLELTITPLSYGNNQYDLPEFMDMLLFKTIFESPKILQLNFAQYNSSDLFTFEKSLLTSEGIEGVFSLHLPKLEAMVELVQNDMSDDFAKLYKNGTQEQIEALSWIEDYNDYSEEITSKVFEDYLDEGKIIHQVLALAKPASLLRIYDEYPTLTEVVSKEVVITSRGKLIGEAVVGYGKVILEALKDLSEEGNLVVSQGYPFDLKAMKTITIKSLMEDYKLSIDSTILSKMSLAYVKDIVYIVYASDEGPYIAISLSGYNEITQENYQTLYKREEPSEGVLTDDEVIYEDIYYALFKYFGEDVFIRYLKNDSQEAYAIVSPESDYQSFTIVLLRRLGDQFEVLGEGFETAIEVNKMYPDFNMNLATRMNESTQILILNSRTKNNIISGLEDKGFMEEGEELTYCSYDGVKYISIALNSGEEYIYTIYRGAFLENVYTVEEALATFSDIDPMIILHPNPSKDIIQE